MDTKTTKEANMKYYAYARNGRFIRQLLVTLINGKTTQEWTDIIYKSDREAMKDMARLNCK